MLELNRIKAEAEIIQQAELALFQTVSENRELIELTEHFQLFYDLWTLANSFMTQYNKWEKTLMENLDSEELKLSLDAATESCEQLTI